MKLPIYIIICAFIGIGIISFLIGISVGIVNEHKANFLKPKNRPIKSFIDSSFNGQVLKITIHDSVYIPERHDTLVYIIIQDSVDFKELHINDSKPYALSYGWAIQPLILFANGKTKDTIQEMRTIYYNKPEEYNKWNKKQNTKP